MIGLGARVVAIELAVATQAVELRGWEQHGRGTRLAAELVRLHVPALTAGATVPDVEPLVAAVQAGTFSVNVDYEAWARTVGAQGQRR
jgi:histidine ammonia-lyase